MAKNNFMLEPQNDRQDSHCDMQLGFLVLWQELNKCREVF